MIQGLCAVSVLTDIPTCLRRTADAHFVHYFEENARLSKDDAAAMLIAVPEGTFLFRTSTGPGIQLCCSFGSVVTQYTQCTNYGRGLRTRAACPGVARC